MAQVRRFLSYEDKYCVDGIPINYDGFLEQFSTPGSVMSDGDADLFDKYYKKIQKLCTYEHRYLLSTRLITKQRLLSLNCRSVSQSEVTSGFSDPSFKKHLSRGYATIRPVKRPDANLLHSYGPFYSNSTTVKYSGRVPTGYGKGKSISFPMNEVNCVSWYLDLIPQGIKDRIKTINSFFVLMPSYFSSFPTLTRYSRFHSKFRGRVRKELLSLDEFLPRLKGPENIPKATKYDVLVSKITEETHPGVITRYISKTSAGSISNSFQRKNKALQKKDILHSVVSSVTSNWHNISNGRCSNTVGYYCIGSREKINVLDFKEVAKARPLFIPEMCDVMVGSTGLEILKMYGSRGSLFKSEIGLGHSDNNLRYYRRLELDVKFKYSFEFDGKEWDSSVTGEVIRYSFEIYRSGFEDGEDVDNHFRFLCDTMINKRLVLHNGNVFDVKHGVSTGHAGTANINSMANWIIGTSTIKNCPGVPQEVREDYELQIMGDDILLHTNFDLSVEVRNKVMSWMEHEFNYKAKDGTIVSEKDKAFLDERSSFLKRIVDNKGMLDTKQGDIWEKILGGPEYAKLPNNRSSYFARRFVDLVIHDPDSLKSLSLYLAFVQQGEENKLYHKKIFELLFCCSKGFTAPLSERWDLFLNISGVSVTRLTEDAERGTKLIQLNYQRSICSYRQGEDYVDYGIVTKTRRSVKDSLQNYNSLPVMLYRDVFKTLHVK